MWKEEIKSIISPKGEIGGISFIINYIILFLLIVISNYAGFFLTVEAAEYKSILIFKILTVVLLMISLLLIIFVCFNYKRRLLSITENLPISIILAIFFTIILDIITLYFYFTPLLFAFNKFIIPIILSIIPSKSADKKEYFSTMLQRYKKFLKNPITIFIIIAIIADIMLVKFSVFRNQQISKIIPDEKTEKMVINPLSNFSGKTKNEILKIRKDFVKTSLFNNENYEPNENVFGQIEDKKPWWGIDYLICSDKSLPEEKIGTGLSEESRFINNPNMLVGVILNKIYPANTDGFSDFCKDKSLHFIPKSIDYDKEHKLIIITYQGSKNFTKRYKKHLIKFQLEGLNAKDFGYKWAYVHNEKNILFLRSKIDMEMVNQKAQNIKSFLHTGNACGIKGGCTNSSPKQPEFEFIFKNIPANMTISLWKNKPLFKNQPADIYVKMIFE